MMQSKSKKLVRVLFQLDPGQWHDFATERLWAETVDKNRFRLRNSPFFAFGVSAEDIVFAEKRDGQLTFCGVSIHGGHSTYRIVLRDGKKPRFQEFWSPIENLGCSYEEGNSLAVDVPPMADIYEVYRLLQEGEDANVWYFDEGHCGHPLKDS